MKKILILSHMRAGSSLLQNLIVSNTNTKLWSRGESNDTYPPTRPRVISNMMKKHRYDGYIDNVLHNDIMVNLEPDMLPIILVRNPLDSLNSMLNIFGDKGVSNGRISGLEQYTRYYETRLEKLFGYVHKRAALLTYEGITRGWSSTSQYLSKYLDMPIKNSPVYTPQPWVGSRGDKGKWIKTGQIQLNRGEVRNWVEVPPRLEQSYARFMRHGMSPNHMR